MALSCTSRLWGLCLPISLGQTDVCTSGWAADGSAVAFAWVTILRRFSWTPGWTSEKPGFRVELGENDEQQFRCALIKLAHCRTPCPNLPVHADSFTTYRRFQTTVGAQSATRTWRRIASMNEPIPRALTRARAALSERLQTLADGKPSRW